VPAAFFYVAAERGVNCATSGTVFGAVIERFADALQVGDGTAHADCTELSAH